MIEDENELRLIVDKARNHDREAFGMIYDMFYDRIYKYVFFKVGNMTEAEDLASQTFAGALKTISNFSWRGSTFASWLFRIANNVVVDYFRRQGRVMNEPIEEHLEIVADVDPAKAAIDNLTFEKVQTAIAKLPKDQQQVVILKYMSNLSNKEAAQVLDRTIGAVKALQFRALENLRIILGSEINERV